MSNAFYKIDVDTHVHTMLSGHSWSSLSECCQQAAAVGLKAICLTDHGSGAPNGPPEWLPITMQMLPDEYAGIRIYKGMEADITDAGGTIVPADRYLSHLEFLIASIHGFTTALAYDKDKCTEAFLAALANPYVCVLGHIDLGACPCDMDAIVRETKKRDKLVEINNSSVRFKKSGARMMELIQLCKRHDVEIVVSSDAHFHDAIGNYDQVLTLLREANFPAEKILNSDINKFDAFIRARRQALGAALSARI